MGLREATGGPGDRARPDQQGRTESHEPAGDIPGPDGIVNVAKLMRMSRMLSYLLEEVRRVPLNEHGRERLRDVADQALIESGSALSDDLLGELSRLTEPLDRTVAPTTAELRVVQAQLEGWIDGVIMAVRGAAASRQAAAGRHESS